MEYYIAGILLSLFSLANGMLLMLNFVERPAMGLIGDVEDPNVSDDEIRRILAELKRFIHYGGPVIMAVFVLAALVLALYQTHLFAYDFPSLASLCFIAAFVLYFLVFGRGALQAVTTADPDGDITSLRHAARKIILIHLIGWIFAITVLVLQLIVMFPI
ncbi:MAG: hypothetical protein NXI13_02925 [Proteobacteria bacterium]|nr:hypothetical protein [Pseudomonadota bacterium]